MEKYWRRSWVLAGLQSGWLGTAKLQATELLLYQPPTIVSGHRSRQIPVVRSSGTADHLAPTDRSSLSFGPDLGMGRRRIRLALVAGSKLFELDLFSADALAEMCDFPALFDRLDPDWVDQALAATGKASMRRRRFPTESVVWLVVGMALARKESIALVASNLDVAMEDVNARPTVAESALLQARNRLRQGPWNWLFEPDRLRKGRRSSTHRRVARPRAVRCRGGEGARTRQRGNYQAFGTQAAGNRVERVFPLVRAVTVVALRSHQLVAGTFAGYGTGELTFASELWDSIPADSLTLIDRTLPSRRR